MIEHAATTGIMLGGKLAFESVMEGVRRLEPGEYMLLYTGVAIVRGRDPVREATEERLTVDDAPSRRFQQLRWIFHDWQARGESVLTFSVLMAAITNTPSLYPCLLCRDVTAQRLRNLSRLRVIAS